jgi:hypothetical protein
MEVTNLGVFNLIAEITGFSEGKNEVKGILNEDISLKTKYYVRELFKDLNKEKERVIESYREWAEKTGDSDFSKFISENKEIANAKVTLKDCNVSIDDLDFKSEYHYPFFLSIVIDKEG